MRRHLLKANDGDSYVRSARKTFSQKLRECSKSIDRHPEEGRIHDLTEEWLIDSGDFLKKQSLRVQDLVMSTFACACNGTEQPLTMRRE